MPRTFQTWGIAGTLCVLVWSASEGCQRPAPAGQVRGHAMPASNPANVVGRVDTAALAGKYTRWMAFSGESLTLTGDGSFEWELQADIGTISSARGTFRLDDGHVCLEPSWVAPGELKLGSEAYIPLYRNGRHYLVSARFAGSFDQRPEGFFLQREDELALIEAAREYLTKEKVDFEPDNPLLREEPDPRAPDTMIRAVRFRWLGGRHPVDVLFHQDGTLSYRVLF